MLGNKLDPGSWPDPKGLETLPPSQLTWWHTLQPGPWSPFFLFLPALFSVKHLLLQQEAWARPLCTHSARAMRYWGTPSVCPLCFLVKATISQSFSCTCHLKVITRSFWGKTSFFFFFSWGIRNHSNILTSLIYEWVFFQTPFSITCLPLAEALIPLWGASAHSQGPGWKGCTS